MFEDLVARGKDMTRRFELHTGLTHDQHNALSERDKVRNEEGESWRRSAEFGVIQAFGPDSAEVARWKSVADEFRRRAEYGPEGYLWLYSAYVSVLQEFDFQLRIGLHETRRAVSSATQEKPVTKASNGQTIIIHGHDERNLLALKDILVSKLRLPEPVIMAQQMVPGASLPEKFEQLAARVDFAVALLTPDDVGRAASDPDLEPRPRQNTLVEIGWFWGRLGRERVLLLVKKDLELPSDLQGVEYYRFEAKVEEVTEKIRDFCAAHGVR